MNNNSSNVRYVAFFDMLGFKEAVKKDIDEAWGALEDVRVSMEEALNVFIKLPQEIIMTNSRDRVLSTNFSDSILIFTNKDSAEDLQRLLLACTGFFAKALHRCVPLRGGISYGQLYVNLEKNLFCGPSLIRAYELGQSVQWSGIVVDNTVAEHYQKNPLKAEGKLVVERKTIPIKVCKHEKRREELWILNWAIPHRANFQVDVPISPQLYSTAFERLFKSTYETWPEDIRAIYDNTVEFINSTLS